MTAMTEGERAELMAVFRSRLCDLIERRWDGSVNAAAQDMGISQPTLHRLVTGKSRNVRGATLVLIGASTPGVRILDWLFGLIERPEGDLTPRLCPRCRRPMSEL